MTGYHDTIDEEFFKELTSLTPLKAYILGVIAFNAKEKDKDSDDFNVVINLNNVKDNDNPSRSISYGYYNDLKGEDQKHYPYFNNIDRLCGYLRKIGNVKYVETSGLTGVLELTITSQRIKEDILAHLNVKSFSNLCDIGNSSNACQGYDLSDFITKCYEEDVNKCSQFVKAYIEKYASIIYDNINVTFYNEQLADNIVKLFDIPYNKQKIVNIVVIQYNSVNMIDLLGMFYSNPECPYYNNYIYTYNNRDGVSIPTIKVFKVDERAVIPSKARYSDAGYDLTIISEYKRLSKNTAIYDTGIQLEIPNGYYVEIVPRSSISRSGYMLANSVGIIDQGYRGNLYIALTKINDADAEAECAELQLPWKCCQMIVKKQVYSKLIVCEGGGNYGIEMSARGTGAFGSTGA
jgi:deoxyuridine 5'-triphosphate nucleotidohydrolase